VGSAREGHSYSDCVPPTAKQRWLLEHCRCPYCRAPLEVHETALHDPLCGRDFPLRDGVFDFLDDESRAAFAIVETDLVSDHPFDANALALIDAVRRSSGMVLDCGSGRKDLAIDHVVQMEIRPYPHVDVLGVNQRLPFADGSFDAVFSLDVLEHVENPFVCAEELARVLRPGGVLYVNMPFLQIEHGHPHHYFNATRMGLRRLFDEHLRLESHHVPLSGHPIFTLYKVIELYDGWLSEEARARFRSLTLGDIQQRDVLEWLDDPIVQEMAVEGRWITASATQALYRKPPAGPLAAELDVGARDLPGFPEHTSAPPAPAVSSAAEVTQEASPRRRARSSWMGRGRRTTRSAPGTG
jgi:SAM-dependent methyltransferase